MNATIITIRLSEFETNSNVSILLNELIEKADSLYISLIDNKNNLVKLKDS